VHFAYKRVHFAYKRVHLALANPDGMGVCETPTASYSFLH